MSLVADYSASSSSSEQEDEEENEVDKVTNTTAKQTVLPSATTLLSSHQKSGEVFQNKFKQEADTKKALLERHVKMVENDEHLLTKNGKKICWNYRKGRCRFGSKCQYAHDSDIQAPEPLKSDSLEKTNTNTRDQQNTTETNQKQKRKRPGLGDSITPAKRVMKAYKQQKQ